MRALKLLLLSGFFCKEFRSSIKHVTPNVSDRVFGCFTLMSNRVSSYSLTIKQPTKNYSIRLSILFLKVRGWASLNIIFYPFTIPKNRTRILVKATTALQPTQLHPWGCKVIYMVREFFELLLIGCHCGSLLKTG